LYSSSEYGNKESLLFNFPGTAASTLNLKYFLRKNVSDILIDKKSPSNKVEANLINTVTTQAYTNY
jgi:hypothetical protein